MLSDNRKGIIGFMFTLAVGVAVGAATLVVGNEVIKGLNQTKQSQENQAVETTTKNSRLVTTPGKHLPPHLEILAKKYSQAKKEYYLAANKRSNDLKEKLEALNRAREEYQQAIKSYRTTPRQTLTNTTTTTQAVKNPFEDDDSQVVSTELISPSQIVNSKSDPISKIPIHNLRMEYYRVKPGDSLSKICQRYYGDAGMWVHILKYQIPSIAASPHLIFPGQLIALPRNLTSGGVGRFVLPSELPTDDGALPPAAPGDESWCKKFQKDYLISDYTLTNTNTMTVEQIQAFLESKKSVLAKPYRGSSPAQMIYNAAKKYGINPQVILTRLQCEQGLITKKTATQKELDWALGVGAYDSGRWNTKFKGLEKQIEGAAATYRRHYLDARAKLDKGQTITMNIDGQTIKVRNAATYAFYKYCPHFHGNKLFYDVWRGYFA